MKQGHEDSGQLTELPLLKDVHSRGPDGGISILTVDKEKLPRCNFSGFSPLHKSYGIEGGVVMVYGDL